MYDGGVVVGEVESLLGLLVVGYWLMVIGEVESLLVVVGC